MALQELPHTTITPIKGATYIKYKETFKNSAGEFTRKEVD